MILINNNFKIKNLRIIAKLNKIHNYSKLNKIDLLNIINCTKAAIIIQTFFRKKNNAELICPLSFENLKYPFICIQNLNKFRYYSLEEFIIYLNKSNNDFCKVTIWLPLGIFNIMNNYFKNILKNFKE